MAEGHSSEQGTAVNSAEAHHDNPSYDDDAEIDGCSEASSDDDDSRPYDDDSEMDDYSEAPPTNDHDNPSYDYYPERDSHSEASSVGDLDDLCDECAKMDFSVLCSKRIRHGEIHPVRILGPRGGKWPAPGCKLCGLFACLWDRSDMPDDDWVFIGLISTTNFVKYSHVYDGDSEDHTAADSTAIQQPRNSRSKPQKTRSPNPMVEQHNEFHRSALILSRSHGDGSSRRVPPVCCPIDLDDFYHQYHRESIGMIGSIFIDHQTRSSQSTISSRIVPPQLKDYSILRHWLHFCIENHGESCRGLQLISVPRFQVLDCNSRQVIRVVDQIRYTALSYVWGEPAPSKGPPFFALEQTIEDAIKVTLELGLQFLWVDRYCIPDDDATIRQAQINMMDMIYEGAELTIIAADGTGSGSGLTGVSKIRPLQPRLNLRDYQLTSSLPHPVASVQYSTWYTRGWTYQEGLLSHRCFYFTEYQVYFECRHTTLQESIQEPEALLAHQTHLLEIERATSEPSSPFGIGETSRVFPAQYLKQVQNDPWLLERRLGEFTSRSLTYGSDALNAFLGVLRQLRHPRFNISHICGVPILWNNTLGWSFEQGFAAGLSWTLEGQTDVKRRLSFPTWSWTGWDGRVSGYIEAYYTGINCPPQLRFEFEKEGDSIGFDEYNKLASTPDSEFAPYFLLITTWVTRCVLVAFVDKDPFEDQMRWVATFNTTAGRYAATAYVDKIMDLTIEADGGIQAGEHEVLILGDPTRLSVQLPPVNHEDPKYIPSSPFLIILEKVEDFYERIGSIKLSMDAIDEDGKAFWRNDDNVGKDLSHYLTGAELRKIKLG
ncbi:HET-domain-containing protein [Rhizodiscina lignyota]|uniref:HET-domain-containing protein n=1 Tax=Rhizodiscina lignyota TaxID=1504668 RepID=A0A9P4M6A7_9PEZI|nr:HET-domain-containing protein [Rhizodiscina lignyota]